MLDTHADSRSDDDDPPPSRVYANHHAAAIRHNAARGMSRRMLEQIYGHTAVHQILGPIETRVTK